MIWLLIFDHFGILQVWRIHEDNVIPRWICQNSYLIKKNDKMLGYLKVFFFPLDKLHLDIITLIFFQTYLGLHVLPMVVTFVHQILMISD